MSNPKANSSFAADPLDRGSSAGAPNADGATAMRTLTIATRKGGASKSTVCVCLYVCAAWAGIKAIIVDLDPQGSALSWAKRRAKRDSASYEQIVVASTPENLKTTLARLNAEGYEFVLIDTPGTIGPAVDPALEACDFALVPSAPTMLDLEAALPTARALHSLGKEFAYVVTSCAAGEQRVSDAEALLDRIAGRAGERLHRRVAYQDAFALGLGVTERKIDPLAAHEITVLWEWVMNRLGLREQTR